MVCVWPDVANARARTGRGGAPRRSVSSATPREAMGAPGPEWASTVFYLFLLLLFLAWLAQRC